MASYMCVLVHRILWVVTLLVLFVHASFGRPDPIILISPGLAQS